MPRFAGFWIRAFADLIDSFLLNGASVIFLLILLGGYFWIKVLSSAESSHFSFFDFFNSFQLQMMLVTMRVGLSLLYFVWATYRYGTTLGKLVLGISVVSARDYLPISLRQSTSRCLGYALSYSLCGAGFLLAAFHPRKQAFHDLIAETVSIRKRL